MMNDEKDKGGNKRDNDGGMKDYFSAEGTVVKWWNPEDPSKDDMAHIYGREARIIHDLVKGFTSRGSALEVSPGKGRLANEIMDEYNKYFGVDISRNMIDAMKARLPEVELILGDSENLPIPSESFDSVFCLEALVHYPEPCKAISEMARVVKPGGDVVISFDNDKGLQRRVTEMQKAYFRKRNPEYQSRGQGIYRALGKMEVLDWISDAGLIVEQVYAVGAIPSLKLKSSDHERRWYIISPQASKLLAPLDELLCGTSLGKGIAAYYVVHAKKAD